MAGSFYINCWAALGSFAIYFLLIFQSARTPGEILMQSFIVAFVAFIATFIVRFLIGYAFYTATPEVVDDVETVEVAPQTSIEQQPQTVTIENQNVEDTQAKEIANVVKTLMAQEN